mgnify:CR=1 FL=1
MLPEIDISDNMQLATLRCLSNPSRLPSSSRAMAAYEEHRAATRGFYKRRIVQLTKDMSQGTYPTAGLENAYRAYADVCAEYLQDVDTRDIIQSTYAGLDVANPSSGAPKAVQTRAHGSNDDLEMLGRAIRPNGLDTFVNRKSVPVAQGKFPEVRSVNLRAPGLRTKGTKKGGKHVHFAD